MQKESFYVNKTEALVVKDINAVKYLSKSAINRFYGIRDRMIYISPDCGNIELLAPASVNSYKEAINGGANAIYFGYGEFNARAGGDNFVNFGEIKFHFMETVFNVQETSSHLFILFLHRIYLLYEWYE